VKRIAYRLDVRLQRVVRGRCGYLGAVRDAPRAVRDATRVVSGGRSSDNGSDVDKCIEPVACSAVCASRGASRSSCRLVVVDERGRPVEIIALIAAVRAALIACSAFRVGAAGWMSSRPAATVVVSSIGAVARRERASQLANHGRCDASSASCRLIVSSRSTRRASHPPSTSSCKPSPSAVADVVHTASSRPPLAAR
jgi:hypothetical protein